MNEVEGSLLSRKAVLQAGLFAGRDVCIGEEAVPRSRIDARLVPARSPAPADFIALLKVFGRSGGTVPGSLFSALHAQHPVECAAGLQARVDGGELFAFEWRGCFWVPLFQFDADRLTPKASAREVRSALPHAWSSWDVATWFAASHLLLEDRCPVDVLDSSANDVICAARSHSS